MSNESLMDEALSSLTGKSTQPELLVSAVLHLMSHYSVNSAQTNGEQACLKLASVIERHLKVLANLPDLAPVLRATCLQLSEQWARLIERSLPQPAKLRRFPWRMASAV